MASRYGRNQKRRARERIAALEKAHEMDRALLDYISKKAASLDAEMRQWDDEVRRLCGEYSALRRKTPTMETNHPIREMPILGRVGRVYAEAAIAEASPMATRERMRRFVFSMDRDDMRLQQLIRFKETDGRGNVVAYSVSETALKHGFGPRDVDYLAREIAHNMVRFFNQKNAA